MKKRVTAALFLLTGLFLAGGWGCGRQAVPEEDRQAGSPGAAGPEGNDSGVAAGSKVLAPDVGNGAKILDPDAAPEEKEPDFYVNSSGIAIRRGNQLTIGFSQIGAESDWRLASSASMENTFSIDNGYNLIFDNAQQKQENQIKAIREFIDQGVDYIVLDPIVETGWASSLREAKEAGIPVIIADREVRLEDESLYTAWIGSDFLLEGKRACEWLKEYLSIHSADQSPGILHIQGTEGSSAQIGRSQALFEAARANGWNILQSVSGDFVQAKGKEVAEHALEKYPEEIQVVYCENDNMAYGAIEALEQAGKQAGTDLEHGEVIVISFDSAADGLVYTLDGRIAVDTECNPLYGPALSRLIMDLETGTPFDKKNYCEEEQFSAFPRITSVTVEGQEYPVTMVTQEMIRTRAY